MLTFMAINNKMRLLSHLDRYAQKVLAKNHLYFQRSNAYERGKIRNFC